ncbi:MAG: cyclic nucleotide-binding domain-containing protein [Proteobacteria bacterium]|nr:cyclic nucleotide-binding domain-containing protein [Pseudomonadota bacterium]
MAKNLAGKSYEVLTAEGNRWILDSTHTVRSAALGQAESLLAVTFNKPEGVRVVSESERTGALEVIFEERLDRDPNVISLAPVHESPVCEKTIDFYSFPARRTAGKLLRRLLDDRGMTALELAFDPGQLMMLERNDKLFGPAMQRIGGIQAKADGSKAMDRVEVIARAFEDIKKRAKAEPNAEKYSALLRAKGLNALVESAGQWEKSVNERRLAILGALAGRISGSGGWGGKILHLIAMSRDAPSPEAVAYVDEIAAEILDGAGAVMEILGGQPDMATANRQLINLSRGSVKPPKNPISCIVELNEMMSRFDLPLTRQVLLERVEHEISGIQNLTKEGRSGERDAFVGLVRFLADGEGMLGGPGMCEAVVKRARIILSEGPNDLTREQAIDHLLDVMPNRAVRLGFLLDLAVSPTGAKDPVLIKQAIDRIMRQLNHMASLVPDASGPDMVINVVNGLKQRLNQQGVPDDWKARIAGELDALVGRLAGGGNGMPKKAKNAYGMDEGAKAMNDKTSEQITFKSGDILFEEGEIGELAYLIISGEVEIFRATGNKERVLAILDRGEIIGEMSLIDNSPRMASARALSDLKLSAISRSSLQGRLDRLEESDRVLRRLIAVLVSRIRGQAQSPE